MHSRLQMRMLRSHRGSSSAPTAAFGQTTLRPAPVPAVRPKPATFVHSTASRPTAASSSREDVARTSASAIASSSRGGSIATKPTPRLLLPRHSTPPTSLATRPTSSSAVPGVQSAPHAVDFDPAMHTRLLNKLPRQMRLTFLGTASGRPTRARNVTSALLRMRSSGSHGTSQREKVLLFDCGDGTQLQSLSLPADDALDWTNLHAICITHMHGDHVFGLPNVIAAACHRADTDRALEPLHVFGPQGIAAFVKANLAATHTWLERPIVFHEVLKGNVKTYKLQPQPDVLYHQSADPTKQSMQIFEDNDFTLHAGFLAHRELSCLGYVVTEKPSPSSAPAKSSSSNSSQQQQHQQQQQTAPPLRKVVLLGDTCDSSNLLEFGRGADLLVHEATFLEADVAAAQRTGHSTAEMAGRFARQLDATHLCLTHFSQRYLPGEIHTGQVDPAVTRQHVREAQAAADEARTLVHAAQDFLTIHILPQAKPTATGPRQPRQQQQQQQQQQAQPQRDASPPVQPPATAPSTAATKGSPAGVAAAAGAALVSPPRPPPSPLRIAMPKKSLAPSKDAESV